MTRYNNGTAAATGIVLVGMAVALMWLALAPGIFSAQDERLEGPLAGVTEAAAPAALIEGMRISESFQISQPRDPFRPLINEDSPTGGEGSGFTPSGITVTVVEIRDVDGTLRATVQVNGITYDVGEGDTFATSFMVVSLEIDCGVFLYGDNAFELCVGETILK